MLGPKVIRLRTEYQVRLLLAVVVAAASVLAWGGSAASRPLDDVVASGTLKVAVYRDNPPFSFRRDGALGGIDVEIGRRIAQSLAVAVEYMEVPADESVDDDLRNAVWKGHPLWGKVVADLMLSIPFDQDLGRRNNEVVLFAPYTEERYVLMRDPKRSGDAQTLLSLRSGGIGVELDSLPDFFLTTTYNGALRASVVHFPTTEAATHAVLAGEVAGVMGTLSRIEAALGDRAQQLQPLPVNLREYGKETWNLGIAVKENARDLGYAAEDVVTDLIATGEMAVMFRARGVSYHPPQL